MTGRERPKIPLHMKNWTNMFLTIFIVSNDRRRCFMSLLHEIINFIIQGLSINDENYNSQQAFRIYLQKQMIGLIYLIKNTVL